MANETTVQTSCIQEDHDFDDCLENIPPGVNAAAGIPKIKKLDKPSPLRAKENNPQLHSPAVSKHNETTGGRDFHAKMVDTPDRIESPMRWLDDRLFPEITLLDVTHDSELSPRGDISCMDHTQDIPALSNLQINNDTISMQETSSSDSNQNTLDKPSSLRAKENNPQLQTPVVSKHNETTGSKDFHAKMADRIESPMRWLDDRLFPEITLLEVTRDSELSPGGDHSCMDLTQDIPAVGSVQNNIPSPGLRGPIVSETGTLDVTEREELSRTLEGNVTHTMSSISELSDKCAGENVMKASLEGTRDISMGSVFEDSRRSLEPSEQNMVKIQTSALETLGTLPANVTHDISTSGDMSAQCASSQFSTSDVQSNTSSNLAVTAEPHSEPMVVSDAMEAIKEEPCTSHGTEMTSRLPQPSLETAGSVNGTFTVDENSAQTPCPQNMTLDLPSSYVNSPKVEINTKEQTSSLLANTTKTSPVINQNNSAVKESGSCDHVQNATFDRHSLHKSGGNTILGDAGAANFCLQNNTFDAKSPSKQNGTITLSETSSSDCLQNAVDIPSGPVVCNATSSPKHSDSEVHPPELLKHKETTASTTSDSKTADTPESTFEANPSTNSDSKTADTPESTFEANPSTNSDSKTADTPESTFEANPAAEVVSGAGQHETKDHSQSGLPTTDNLSDTLGNQSVNTENSKANTLNLDDTLDLRADCLVTSTPMTDCKMFNFHTEREGGKILAAQKKLYGDGPSKPDCQTLSTIPSNIVCDRKTFLTQPAVKSFLPPSKVVSQLLKHKPASTLPGKTEPLTSGLPMTRQRTQAEALRNTAASEAPQVTTGISSSYNLRTTATGSKQPISGLRKPQTSGLPSGIQRPATGVRLPSTRSKTPASLNTDALRGPTVTNPPAKISHGKKHPLTRNEALPVAKKKKIDAPLISSSAEASMSACDANKAKNLKKPATSQRALPAKIQRDDAAVKASNGTGVSASCEAVSKARALQLPTASHKPLLGKPQSHGCPRCVALEQQLELKSEEIRRLKEELLKNSKPQHGV